MPLMQEDEGGGGDGSRRLLGRGLATTMVTSDLMKAALTGREQPGHHSSSKHPHSSVT